MLISLLTTLIVSLITKIFFEKRILSPRLDVLHCFIDIPNEILPLKESTTVDELQQYRITKPSEQQLLNEPIMLVNNSYSPSPHALSTHVHSSAT
mgnify:FL=1